MSSLSQEIPRGDRSGFFKYLRNDLLSGFFVFLIALPLCLGIAQASGYPPMAGIFTAVIGSILSTFISNSELTIKGPAAGLIVIAVGCIKDFGGNDTFRDSVATDIEAYRSALAVGVAAAVLQILFGIFRAGILGEFFPRAAIHGMLAAIGVIIIAKQIPVALGVDPALAKGEPVELLEKIPKFFTEANPAIAIIGLIGLMILFTWPIIRKRVGPLTKIPPQLIVLLVAVILGLSIDLLHEHSYTLQGHTYALGEMYLVKMPKEMFGMFKEVTMPNFAALAEPKAWKWVFMFFIIGSLESILSAKAIDAIDPWKRKTNMDRDVLAVGIANLCAAMVGGLPMISEIVRSKANIDNGARTRYADMWHGIFLLACVALLPTTLHLIPRTALAAMLIYTGTRLAHPSEFIHVYQIGREQLIIFVTTLVATLWIDLLVGIAAGIGVKILIHLMNGVPLRSLFKPYLNVEQVDDNTCRIYARESAVFSNWIPFRRQLEELTLVQRQNVILDLSDVRFIDHTFMEKLHEMQQDLQSEEIQLDIVGLDRHQPLAQHSQSARKRGLARMRRITVVAEQSLEERIEREVVARGATGFTAIACRGAGRRHVSHGVFDARTQVRIEVIVPFEISDGILSFLRNELMPQHHITTCVETVEVVLAQQFLPLPKEGSQAVHEGH